MYHKTAAIVLSQVKYSDNSLIVKCFTQAFGTRSYLLKGILKNKKSPLATALFQPLTLLELVVTNNDVASPSLEYIKEARLKTTYKSLHTHPYKSAVGIFLSELSSYICPPDTPDEELFNFMASQLVFFDQENFLVHFHLKFLVDLTQYLGFYPDTSAMESPFFNLEEGTFSSTESAPSLSGEVLLLFKRVLTTSYPLLSQLHSSRGVRKVLLHQLLKYYQWHYPNFRKLKSVEVLEALF